MAPFVNLIYEWDSAEAERYFEYAGYRARNVSEPLRDAGRAIRRSVDRAFASEGASTGDAWEDLKDSYKPSKQSRYGHVYPILHGRGRLRDKATLPSATKVRSSPEGGYLIYSVDSPYAAWQSNAIMMVSKDEDSGVYFKPARPFVVITPDLAEEINDGFRDWLEDIKADNSRRRNTGGLSPFRGVSAWL